MKTLAAVSLLPSSTRKVPNEAKKGKGFKAKGRRRKQSLVTKKDRDVKALAAVSCLLSSTCTVRRRTRRRRRRRQLKKKRAKEKRIASSACCPAAHTP